MNGLYDEIRLAIYGVWNRRWLVLAAAWAICLAGWLVLTFIPNSYESKARIFVQSQDLLSSELSAGSSKRDDIDRLEKTLTSTINLEKVVRQTGLSGLVKTDRDMQITVEMLRDAIKVTPERDNLFAVTAELSSSNMSDKQAAALSRDVVQKLIDLFQEDNIATDRAGTNNTLRFLDAQIEERQKAMAEAEQRRIAFETQNLGILPGAQSASARTQAARTELGQIESQLIQAQSSLAALNGQVAGTPPTISTFIPGAGGGPAQSPAQAQLAQGRSDLAAMRARGMTDNHPDVITQQRQISYLQQQANAAPAPRSGGSSSYQSPNPAYSSLISMRSERQAQVAALQARKNALDAELSGLSGKLAAEPGVAAEYEKLNREYTVQKDHYDKLMAERERVRLRGDISSETDAVQFRVIDPPSSPLAPSAPNRPLLIVGVLILGLGAGVFLAFAMSHMQSTYASPMKLERATGLPVLGSISQMLTPKEASERQRWLKYYYGAAASLVGVFALLMVIEIAQRSAFV